MTSGQNQPSPVAPTGQQLSYNQQHTLQTPPSQTVFAVVESDWTTLRSMIGRIQNPFKLSETFGGIFLGAVFGPVADLAKYIKAHPQDSWTGSEAFIWVVVFVALSIICFLIGFAQKQAAAQTTEIVFDYMDNLQERAGSAAPTRAEKGIFKAIGKLLKIGSTQQPPT